MHLTFRSAMGLALVAVLSAGAQTAGAQTATPTPAPTRSYAVVSEVGQQLQMVGFKQQVGSRLDTNTGGRVDTPGGALDKAALLAAQSGFTRAVPGAPVFLVSPLDVLLFPSAGNPSVGQTLQIPKDLADVLQQKGSTHLLLLNRRSSDASFQALNGRVGSGRAEGLGFYVDRNTEMLNRGKGESAAGFLATFVYVNLSLVDAQSGRVLAVQPITDSRLDIASVSSASGHPWESVSNADKMTNLLQLLQAAVEQTVPLVLAPAPAAGK